MFRRKYKTESLRSARQVALCLLRGMRGMVIQQQPQLNARWITFIKLLQKRNEVAAVVCVAYNLDHFASVKVQSRQQRHPPQSLVFVVAQMTRMFAGNWRPIWSSVCQRLDTRFLVVRNSHEVWFLDRPTNHSFIYDFHLFVNVQYRGHLLLELRIAALHIIADLMRSDLGLRKYPVQFGPAQLVQFIIASRFAFLVDVGHQQSIGPQFLLITQVLRFLTSAMRHPRNRLVGKLSRLARSRQLTQGSIQSKSQTLLNVKNHGVT